MSGVNLNNIYVGDNGRIQLSGGSSNIDFVDVVDKMIAARRIPAVTLEDRIEKNDEKLAALREMQDLVTAMKDSLSKLYGATSFDKSKDIFESKQVYATSSNGGGSASSAAELVGVTATNAAAAGSYSLEIDQIASKHKVAGNVIAANPADDATGVIGTGQFTIGGGIGSAQITVSAGDSLQDIRDQINALKGNTGIQASLVKVADGQTSLILTSTKEGAANRMTLSDDSGSVLQNLGILSDATTINVTNEVDIGNDAQFKLDGVTITRSSNEVTDLVDGLTFSLFAAEPGTTIALEVEQDLNQAKEAIVGFVDAYNALQTFINEKTYVDSATSKASEDAILLGNSAVKSVESALRQLIGTPATGVTDIANKTDYSLLAEIGINFLPNAEVSDPKLLNTLKIDDAKLNQALLTEPDEVMELFNFRGGSDNPNVSMTNFTNNTKAGEYVFDIQASGGTITSVTYSITGDASAQNVAATVSGNYISTENGLKLFYSGSGNMNETATVNTSVGVGAQFFFELNKALDTDTGTLTQEISTLEQQNTAYQDKVDRIDERLVGQRETLMDKFIAMETALARMKNIQSSLDELMAAGKEDS
ncbi:flagellar filament capping protein FliD [Thalassospira xiamenensis]|uniref:Flagellar hook-associated protein 2 n=1 Tax=Thalassospira xiamenensis TaxID=220697 RepID=A0A285RSX8_9PROT|nr:flagellar filament capping protein FliD [Thalassospira xiamenensis]SOB95397.1 flagellar hook-associated protein 2 [Thalassospira xiamenensis]